MSFWRKLYSASSWSTVVDAMRTDALARNGAADDGAARLSNHEAVALVEEMRHAARDTGVALPGWEGMEAIAYAMEPSGAVFADDIQRDMRYPDEWAAALWEYLGAVAGEMDRADKRNGARALRPDEDVWPSAYRAVQKEKDCRVPLPGIPAKDWPTCDDVIDRIKKKLPPPGEVAPIVPIIGGIKRIVPLVIAIAILFALTTDD